VWSKRLKETVALITIGDGALALIAPKEHSLLWEVGPEGIRKITRFFADNPTYMRLLGASQIAFGVWLAFRQYREE
jgi:hypothetical protein